MLQPSHHHQVVATGAVDHLAEASQEWEVEVEVLVDGEHTMRMIVE
jgi:hypothetical protein